MNRIDHRVAIVNGGTRGIGADITTTLARAGYHVAAGYSACPRFCPVPGQGPASGLGHPD